MDAHQLRDATRVEHEATEALMPLMGPGLTRDRYVEVLETLYPLVLGWETWVAEAAPPRLRAMLERHRRGHLLLADLEALREPWSTSSEQGPVPNRTHISFAGDKGGVDWAAVVAGPGRCLDAEEFEAGLLGAVYVMEGSTLGGRFLARHVEAALGLEPGVGNAYFRGHGEATGAMWREVLTEIEGVPEPFAPLVIEAARRTFGAFGEALKAGLAIADTVQS